MNKINYSIIIPHYNALDKLVRLLGSIPDEEDIEVIIVDDYSNDEENLINTVKSHSGKNTRLLFNDGKKSAGTCRNIGVKEACGKWLIFADADDFFLDEMYHIISEYVDSTYDIIYFTPTSLDESNGKPALRHVGFENRIKAYLESGSNIDELILKVKTSQPWSKLISRELVLAHHVKFDQTLRANDVMFSSKTAYCAKKIFATTQKIYCCTRNDTSITTRRDIKYFDDLKRVFVRNYYFWKKRLSYKQFYLVDLNALNILIESVSFEHPLYVFASGVSFFLKNRVKIIPRKLYNPELIIRYNSLGKFGTGIRDVLEKRKYYGRNLMND